MTMYKHPLSRERGGKAIYVKEFETGPDGRPRLKRRHRIPAGLVEGTVLFIQAYQRICALIERGTAKHAKVEPTDKAAVTAHKLATLHKKDSLAWLVKTYWASKRFSRLARSTQMRQRATLELVCMMVNDEGFRRGDCSFASLRRTHVSAMQEQWSDAPRLAEARVGHLSSLFDWACDIGHAEFNPCSKVKPLDMKSTKGKGRTGIKAKRGTIPWEDRQMAAWWAAHSPGSEAHTAAALGFYGGLRRSDIVRVGPSNVDRADPDRWFLCWTEHKNEETKESKVRRLEILLPLRRALEAAEAGRPDQKFFVGLDRAPPHVKQGDEYLELRLGGAFRRWREAAGLSEPFTIHGWRAGGACWLTLRGWTPHEIMAWGGWTSIKQVVRYTQHIDRQRLSDQSTARLNGELSADERRAKLKVVQGGR